MKTDRFEIKLDNCTVIATNDEPAQFPEPHTFPTWEEFEKEFPNMATNWMRQFYIFFKSRVQPLEIGREYDVSDDGEDWVRDALTGYKGAYDVWNYIRPIQPDPKQALIERLKAVQDNTGAVADAIKALEEPK